LSSDSIFDEVNYTIKRVKYKRKARFSFYFRTRVSSTKPIIRLSEHITKFLSQKMMSLRILNWGGDFPAII